MPASKRAHDKFFDGVYQVLLDGKPRGVSVIAKHIGAPAASVHRYLLSQEFFVQGPGHRKWSIPEYDVSWPLFHGETEPPEDIKAIIKEPLNHGKKILELIKYYEELQVLIARRITFLHNIGRDTFERELRMRSTYNRGISPKLDKAALINKLIQFKLDNHEISRSLVGEEREDLSVLSESELHREIGKYL